ncbi:hypothetical protein ACHAW5_005635 [Stephanodiscus triporus]|uniref:DUF6824 domain-containing protein n=1 Tax=Stephanodiscus triporus TaxID=2934178 RepID=A0ABD3MSZ5_9STRA
MVAREYRREARIDKINYNNIFGGLSDPSNNEIPTLLLPPSPVDEDGAGYCPGPAEGEQVRGWYESSSKSEKFTISSYLVDVRARARFLKRDGTVKGGGGWLEADGDDVRKKASQALREEGAGRNTGCRGSLPNILFGRRTAWSGVKRAD